MLNIIQSLVTTVNLALVNNKMKKLLFLSTLLIFGCSEIEIKDITINIQPYKEAERGKFWDICIKANNISSNDKLYVYFEVKTNYGELRKFERTFFDFGKEECNKINTLVYFTNRYTTNEEFDWLKKLVASEIEYINVKVKKQYSDNKYIYREKIFSKNLSSN